MPVPPAELTAAFAPGRSAEPDDAARLQAAVVAAAGGDLHALDSGPGEVALSGSRAAVLEAVPAVLAAALEAGVRAVEVRLEQPTESRDEP